MDCQEVQSLLSAYHDGELLSELRPAVAEHIGSCVICRKELSAFDRISGISKQLPDLEPPQAIWAGIEAALDADLAKATVRRPAIFRRTTVKRWQLGLLVTAAVALIAFGIVWVASGGPSRHRELAADFEQYLDHFNDNPETAQNILLAKYEGTPIDLAQAETLVGYRPAVASGLPKGYSLDATYALKMPCCTCVQTICRREDGRVFAIFEHSNDQMVRCGDGQMTRTECNGRSCMLMQGQNSLLATWKSGKRQFTVVGARDLEEVGDLMTHLDAGGSDT